MRLNYFWILLLLIVGGCTAPTTSPQAGTGLLAQYFSNSSFSGTYIEQIQSEINFAWGDATPALGMRGGAFSARWSGWLAPGQSGSYTFYLNASGQARLYLGDSLLIDGGGQATAQLTAGQRPPIRLEFVKTAQPASLSLEWSGPSFERQSIPREKLFPTGGIESSSRSISAGQNVLLNADFENGMGNWRQVSGDFSLIPGRDANGYAISLKNTGSAQQDIPYSLLRNASTLTFEAWGRSVGGQACTVGLQAGGENSFSKELSFSGDWERKSLELNLPKGTRWMVVYLSGSSECQFDDVFLGVLAATLLPTPIGSNLLINPDYEQNLSGWEVFGGSAASINPGYNSNRALQAAQWAWLQQVLPAKQVEVGKSYLLSVWLKPSNGTTCSFGVLGGSGNRTTLNMSYSYTSSGSNWIQRSLQPTIDASLEWLYVWLQPSSGTCQYDNLVFAATGSNNATPEAPASPSSFKALNTGNSVDLSWGGVAGADSYVLERREGSGSYATLTTTGSTRYSDLAVTAGTTYTYRLKATNAVGSSRAIEATVAFSSPTAKTVWVLYDSGVSSARTFPSSYKRVGGGVSLQAFNESETAQLNAVMTANLIGRYPDLKVQIKPVSSYTGLSSNVLRVFYIGSSFDAVLPEALLRDAAAGAPITWVGYNIWQLGDRLDSLGLTYNSVVVATTAAQVKAGYNTITYRGYAYQKLTNSGGAVVPTELVSMSTSPSNTVHAWASNAAGKQIPYAIQSGNFWYIADMPFSYSHELDRYVAFSDMIGLMLGHGEICSAKALVRLEDVSPQTSPADLKAALDVLEKLQIPFGVAIIPQYRDGLQNITQNFSDQPDLVAQLRRIPALGGRFFQHGYTHQYKNLANPSGISGLDWEFWDNAKDAPITGMTADEAVSRIQTGKQLLMDLGLLPVGWITPHYAMAPDFYAKVNTLYDRFYERRLYQVGQTFQGQFFPYPVRDVSGAFLIPENTNYVGETRRPADIVEVARANRALHCPWVGSFFHPFLLGMTASQGGVTASEFENMLTSIRSLGYTFVDPSSVTLGQ